MVKEQVVRLVRAYEVGKPDSLVVVVPKELRDSQGITRGSRFLVKLDELGRLIYEPVDSLAPRLRTATDLK